MSETTEKLLADALRMMLEAKDRNEYPGWEKGIPDFAKANEAAITALAAHNAPPAQSIEPELDLSAFDGCTPGIWILERISGDFSYGIRVSGECVSGYTAFVAVDWPHADQRVELEANARLIAAAPLLLAELRRFRSTSQPPPAATEDARDVDIQAWVERHGLESFCLKDMRCAFEDAQSWTAAIASERGKGNG